MLQHTEQRWRLSCRTNYAAERDAKERLMSLLLRCYDINIYCTILIELKRSDVESVYFNGIDSLNENDSLIIRI